MSITLNAGSGGATLGTDTVTGTPNVDYQIVKIGYSTAGTTPTQVSSGNPLPVAQTGALPAGSNVIGAVTQSGGPWSANLTQIGGNAANTGNGTAGTGTLRVVLASDQTSLANAIPVSQSGSWTVNLGTLNGAALDSSVNGLLIAQGTALGTNKGPLLQGSVTTAAPTYTTGNINPLSLTTGGALRVDASAATVPISAASLPLPTGAATSAKQPALGTAGSASADVITVQGIAGMTALKVDGSAVTQPISGTVTTNPPANASTNIAQVGGTATDTNSGNKSAGTLRVVIATDQPSLANAQPVSQSGTWTVQPGNSANTTPWLVTEVPTAGQGASVNSQLLASAGVIAANIKASAGTIYSIDVTNNNSTPVFVRLYDKATAPATTDTPIWRGIVPGNSGAAGMVRVFGQGIKTANGIGIRVTGAIADNDATNVNNVAANVEYA